MFKKLLAAVDGSTHGAGVLKVAVTLAERFDGRVHLYRAIEIPPDIPAAAANPPDPLRPFLIAKALQELHLLAAGDPRVIVEPPAVLHGRPWRGVLHGADLLEVDLIVIGSHGYKGWDRLLGTNAGAIANRARCNVLVVHSAGQG